MDIFSKLHCCRSEMVHHIKKKMKAKSERHRSALSLSISMRQAVSYRNDHTVS